MNKEDKEKKTRIRRGVQIGFAYKCMGELFCDVIDELSEQDLPCNDNLDLPN